MGHFEPLVCLSWKMCSSGGPSSLQMTICKWKEEHGGGRIIQKVICNNPCSSIPLILVIWRTVLFANDHLQRNGGAQRRPDHPDGHLQQSVLLRPFDFGHLEDSPVCKWPFAKERRRPDHPDDHLQQFVLLCPLNFGHPENRPLCKLPTMTKIMLPCWWWWWWWWCDEMRCKLTTNL